MVSNNHAFTATGKIKRPSYSTVATWVKESWDEISPDLIRSSFKCCGVSTKLDGSEDHLLFEYNKVSADSDDEVEDPESDEYPEEDGYENDWKIGYEVDSETDVENGDEDGGENSKNVIYGKKQVRGKGKEKEIETEEEEGFSDEDVQRFTLELLKKNKKRR